MGNARIEREAKMMLTAEEYALLSTLLPFETTLQINHYFFGNQQYVLRIREFPDRSSYLFTLKIKVPGGHREHECAIPSCSLDYPAVNEICKEYGITSFEALGKMTTLRKHYATELGEFCLDISNFFGQIDYEFEYELKNAEGDYHEAYAFLQKAGITYQENTVSKFARFLNARAKQK